MAADSIEIAEKALTMIEVDYDPLPNINSVDEAMKDDSEPIHPEAKALGSPPYASRNVNSYTRIHRGNVEPRAFKEADFVLEETYSTQRVHQSYIETKVVLSEVDGNTGRIKVWSATQSPNLLRASLAGIFGVPVSSIQVFSMQAGGGFGSKATGEFEAISVALARKSSRPVKTSPHEVEEELIAGTPRPSVHFWLKSGVRDGRVTARKARAVVDGGGFASEAPCYSSIACPQLLGVYDIPNLDLEGISVYTNKQPAGTFRAPGSAETNFAVESHTDMHAKRAGIDPSRVPACQLLDRREPRPDRTGPEAGRCEGGAHEGIVIDRMEPETVVRWCRQRLTNQVRCRDCLCLHPRGRGHGELCLHQDERGRQGQPDHGCDRYGRRFSYWFDDDSRRGDWGQASGCRAPDRRLEFRPLRRRGGGEQDDARCRERGPAGDEGCEGAAADLAASTLKVDGNKIVLKDGVALDPDTGRSVKISELANAAVTSKGGPIVGSGAYAMEYPAYDKDSIEGQVVLPSLMDPAFVAHAVVVSVDGSTGKVVVERFVAAHDVGRAINPLGVEGQIHGGAVRMAMRCTSRSRTMMRGSC